MCTERFAVASEEDFVQDVIDTATYHVACLHLLGVRGDPRGRLVGTPELVTIITMVTIGSLRCESYC